MTTGYALAYVTRGNSFHRCYNVFYLNEKGIVKRLDIGAVPMNAAHLGEWIAQYQMANNGNSNSPNPISFRRPADFPDVAQLGSNYGKANTETVFSELTSKELRAATRSMMKTLKGE